MKTALAAYGAFTLARQVVVIGLALAKSFADRRAHARYLRDDLPTPTTDQRLAPLN